MTKNEVRIIAGVTGVPENAAFATALRAAEAGF